MRRRLSSDELDRLAASFEAMAGNVEVHLVMNGRTLGPELKRKLCEAGDWLREASGGFSADLVDLELLEPEAARLVDAAAELAITTKNRKSSEFLLILAGAAGRIAVAVFTCDCDGLDEQITKIGM